MTLFLEQRGRAKSEKCIILLKKLINQLKAVFTFVESFLLLYLLALNAPIYKQFNQMRSFNNGILFIPGVKFKWSD